MAAVAVAVEDVLVAVAVAVAVALEDVLVVVEVEAVEVVEGVVGVGDVEEVVVLAARSHAARASTTTTTPWRATTGTATGREY